MPAMTKIMCLTSASLPATWMAASCWRAARAIWQALDPAVEDDGTTRCCAAGDAIAEAADREERLRLLFSAGF